MKYKMDIPQIYRMFTIIGLIVIWGLASCENPSTVSQADYSVVKGRIADENAQAGMAKATSDVKDVAVFLARVRTDGSMETVSQETVHTDASGRFAIRTRVENENNLIVVASRGAAQWRAVVSGNLENGKTTYCAPLSRETTVETEVYSRIRLYNDTKTITYADIQHQISPRVAAEVYGDAVAISQIASSIETGFQAQNSIFLSDSGDVTESEMAAIAEAKAELQSQFDAQLYHSSSDHPDKQLTRMFINGYLEAYSNAGVNLENYAKSQAVAYTAVRSTTGSMRDSLRFAFLQEMACFRAEIIDMVIQSRFETLGASDSTMTAVINARAKLQASIEAASTVNEIRSAFTAYHSTIVALLRITLDINSELITQLDASIWGKSGFYGSLEQQLSVSFTTAALIDAYTEFYAAAESEAFTVLNTIVSDVQVNAVVTVLVMANFMV